MLDIDLYKNNNTIKMRYSLLQYRSTYKSLAGSWSELKWLWCSECLNSTVLQSAVECSPLTLHWQVDFLQKFLNVGLLLCAHCLVGK
jgi:hypothetical protein